jgi:hypothetical protein
MATPRRPSTTHEAVTSFRDGMICKVLMACSGREKELQQVYRCDETTLLRVTRCDLAKVALCLCAHLHPNAGTTRASGFGLFSKAPVESAAQCRDRCGKVKTCPKCCVLKPKGELRQPPLWTSQCDETSVQLRISMGTLSISDPFSMGPVPFSRANGIEKEQ